MRTLIQGRTHCTECSGSGVRDKRLLYQDDWTYCACAVELVFDGVSFWVNERDQHGMNLARFSRLGIDIHRPFSRICMTCMYTGDESLFGSSQAWQRFLELLEHYHDVKVPESFVRPEASWQA